MAVTWNPSDKNANITLSNGNLTAQTSVGNVWASVRATSSKSSGKWYFEYVSTYFNSFQSCTGIMRATHALNKVGSGSDGWGMTMDGLKFHSNSQSSYGTSPSSGSVMMLAVDLDAGKVWWGTAGTWMASGNPVTGENPAFTNVSGSVFPAAAFYVTTGTTIARFSESSLSYAPPSGYSVWDYEPPVPVELPRLIQIPQPHNSGIIARLGL